MVKGKSRSKQTDKVMPDFGPSWNVAPQTFSPLSASIATQVSVSRC